MRGFTSINRELNQKVENIAPDELGEYLHTGEMSICSKFSSGEWNEAEADIELEKLRQEVKDAADNLSIYQYLQFRESYNDAAITALGLSYFQDLIRLYDCIDWLLRVIIIKTGTLEENDKRIKSWIELQEIYKNQREGVTSCKFWKENHPDAAEVQS